MIYTITFNPSIDYIVKVDNLKFGEINRADMNIKYPGGKGINISRVLNNLGVKSVALGFIGGFTGEYIKDFLEKEGIETDFIKIKEDTRINIKLKSNLETEINALGPNIEDEHLIKLYSKLEKATKEDFIVLAGSIQKSLPTVAYSRLQANLKDGSTKFIIDTTGEALFSTLKYRPFLIKPNINELAELFGVQLKTKDDIIFYGKKLLNMGAENIIVSMASDGAILICSKGIYHAHAPKGIVKNSVGAGDSLIAGFISHYSQNYNIIEAFKFGTASGSATAFSLDLCTKSEAERLSKEVIITKI